MFLTALILPLAMAQQQALTKDDDLLKHLVGKWRITREFPKRPAAQNDCEVTYELDGHWLKIAMKDVERPAKYEAHVYITRMVDTKQYSIHWLDSFGGTLPESLGTGTRKGDAIEFLWKDQDGDLRNTFTWHPKDKTWTSLIDQKGKEGKWTVFCTDTYRPAK